MELDTAVSSVLDDRWEEEEEEQFVQSLLRSAEKPFDRRVQQLFDMLDRDLNGRLAVMELIRFNQLLYWQEVCVFVMGKLCSSSALPILQFAVNTTRQMVTDYGIEYHEITFDQILFWYLYRGDSIFNESFYHLPSEDVKAMFDRIPSASTSQASSDFQLSIRSIIGNMLDPTPRTQDEIDMDRMEITVQDGQANQSIPRTDVEASLPLITSIENTMDHSINNSSEHAISSASYPTPGDVQDQNLNYQNQNQNQNLCKLSQPSNLINCLARLYQSIQFNLPLNSIIPSMCTEKGRLEQSLLQTGMDNSACELDSGERREIIRAFGRLCEFACQSIEKHELDVLSLRLLFILLDGLSKADVETDVAPTLVDVIRDPLVPSLIPKMHLQSVCRLLVTLLSDVKITEGENERFVLSVRSQSPISPSQERVAKHILDRFLAFAAPCRVEIPSMKQTLEQEFATGYPREGASVNAYEGGFSELVKSVFQTILLQLREQSPRERLILQLLYQFTELHPKLSSNITIEDFLCSSKSVFQSAIFEEEAFPLTSMDIAMLTGFQSKTQTFLHLHPHSPCISNDRGGEEKGNCRDESQVDTLENTDRPLSAEVSMGEHVDLFSRDRSLGILIRVCSEYPLSSDLSSTCCEDWQSDFICRPFVFILFCTFSHRMIIIQAILIISSSLTIWIL